MMLTRVRLLAPLLGAAALAACSGGAPRVKTVSTTVPATAADSDQVFDLLMQGKESDARKQLARLLKRDPASATLRLLSDSIERDPKELLGPASFPYTVRAGDTAVALSERFLGNRLKAYQFIRYNGLKAPVVLSAGQVLRIPGEPPRPEPVRRVEPVAPARPAPAARAPVAAKAKANVAAKATVAPAADPAAARAARAAGLAALNAGTIERAVNLLRRAAALDPGNPLIVRDLARAERIASTVRARR